MYEAGDRAAMAARRGRLMTSALEQAARRSWLAWADYRKYTFCDACGLMRPCGAARRRGPWLCIACHDLGARR